MCASIELNFFCLEKEDIIKIIKKFKLPFREIEDIKLNQYRYNLPEEIFKYNKDKVVFTIILYSQKRNFEFKFHIYKGENIVYIGRDYFFENVYELIIFSDKKHIISQHEQIFTNFDSLENKYRKRLTLINVESRIVFDNKSINLDVVINNNINQQKDNDNNNEQNFYQISMQFDSEGQKFYIIKNIQEINDELNLTFFKEQNRIYKNSCLI